MAAASAIVICPVWGSIANLYAPPPPLICQFPGASPSASVACSSPITLAGPSPKVKGCGGRTTGLPSFKYLAAICANVGQFGTGVCPSIWRLQPTAPSMNAMLKGGVPPIDSSGPEVNTVPSGITCPGQPSRFQTGEASRPDKKQPRGSAHASPNPGGVSVPLVANTARGAINEVVE